MKVAAVLLLCVLGTALLASVHANNSGIPDNCCFQFYPRKIRVTSRIKSYFVTDERCPRPAAVLETQSGRKICVNPSLPWIEEIMRTLDESSF